MPFCAEFLFIPFNKVTVEVGSRCHESCHWSYEYEYMAPRFHRRPDLFPVYLIKTDDGAAGCMAAWKPSFQIAGDLAVSAFPVLSVIARAQVAPSVPPSLSIGAGGEGRCAKQGVVRWKTRGAQAVDAG
jgi:hypothetical protein